MARATATRAPGSAELATLKLLALEGAMRGEVKVSCADLAGRLDASSQTASRRLQALEDGGLLRRETVSDGQWVAITAGGERALEAEYEDYRRIFEERADLVLAGAVTSGMGEGGHYIALPGYAEQFVERLGYEPFQGTLNVDLTPESRRERTALDGFDPIPIDGWEDDERTYGPASCYPATVMVRDGETAETSGAGETAETAESAHVIVPVRTHHDDDQIELIAPVKLRDELGLADGDEITIRVEES